MPTDGEPQTPSVADIERQLDRLAAKGALTREFDAHGESTFTAARPAPMLALMVLSFLCSLGTGSLWTGLPFVAEHDFHFTKSQNMWLAVAESAVYAVVAFFSGGLMKRLAAHAAPRTVLGSILLFTLAMCLLTLTGSVAALIATALGVSAASAMMWPIVESYLSSGRHGHQLRSAVGVFNIVWTSATALGLVLMGPVFATDYSRIAIVAIGPVCALGAFCLPWFPASPPPHLEHGLPPAVPAVYRPLRSASRALLPTSYLLIGTLGPMLPYITGDIGVAPEWQTPTSSMWHAVRVVAMLAMWRLAFWHGKWATLATGAALMAGGFLLAMGSGSVTMLLVALAAFGAGHAVLYYASLYYAMSVGHAEVDAGGHFEALIGVGYITGPIASLIGMAVAGETGARGLVFVLAAGASMLAAREWWRWRRSATAAAADAPANH
jgi:MFS family permease